MKKYILSIILLSGGAFFELLAQNSMVPGQFRIDPPTVHCLGFRWAVSGDMNTTGRAQVQYREHGEIAWKDALGMLRQDGQDLVGGEWLVANMFAGSIFNLTENITYEVKITLSDPDNGSTWAKDTTVTVTTNSYPAKFLGGSKVHVYPTDYSGAKQAPNYATIEEAANAASPGTIILVHAGIYIATHDLQGLSGTKDSPIVFRAAGDGEAILDGSSDPTANLFDISGSKHIHIESLTFRNCSASYGTIRATGVVGLVVRNCHIYDIASHAIISVGVAEQTKDWFIMNNTIKGVYDPWYPRHHPSGDPTGIVACGQNMVICFNDISDLWDGITPGYPGGPSDKTNPYMCSIDFYNNYIHEILDDHIETDYSASNVRVWNNLCINACHGLSAQPVFGGPIYFFRNIVYNCEDGPLKFHNTPSGIEVYNNTFVSGWYSPSDWMNGKLKNNVFLDGLSRRPSLVFETGSLDSPPRTHLDYNGYLDLPPHPYLYLKWVNPDLTNGRCNAVSLSMLFAETGHEEHGLRIGLEDFINIPDPVFGSTYDSADLGFQIASQNARPVDKGCILPSITDGYAGIAPDLGAIEYGTPLPHYGIYQGDVPPLAVKKRWETRGYGEWEKMVHVNAYPNPFRSSVVISALAGDLIKSLKVYDVKGRLVYQNTEVGGQRSEIGLPTSNFVSWAGIDHCNKQVASGKYFLKANTLKGTATSKVNLVR